MATAQYHEKMEMVHQITENNHLGKVQCETLD